MAQDQSLDLVEVDPTSDPPVCRIEDYGRKAFEEQKKHSKAKKKQKQPQVKTIRLKPRIEDADYQVKLKNMLKFLGNGDKVKVMLTFRGREMAFPEMGRELMSRVEEDLAAHGKILQPPKQEGRLMVMVIEPLPAS